MNVGQAKRLLNMYLQRVGGSDGSGGWREVSLEDLLTVANNYYFWRIAEYARDRIAFLTRFTYDADAEHVSLLDKLGSMPGMILYGGVLTKNEAISRTNQPIPLGWPRRTHLDTRRGGGFTGVILVDGAEIGDVDPSPKGYRGYDAWVQGSDLVLRPIPTDDKFLVFRWVPERLPDLKDDADDLLGGVLTQFHQAVVLKAAIDLKGAKGEKTEALEKQLVQIVGDLGFEQKLRRAVGVQRAEPQYMDSP